MQRFMKKLPKQTNEHKEEGGNTIKNTEGNI